MASFSGWATVRDSYVLFLRAIREAFLAAGFWILVLTAFRAAFYAVVGLIPSGRLDLDLMGWSYSLGQIFLFALAYAATAVTWHQYVLLGRRPSPWPSVTFTTLKYLLLLIALFVGLWFVPFLAAAFLLPESLGDDPYLSMLLPMLIGFALFALSLRFFLKLPAIAIDDRKMTIGEAWRQSGPLWPGLVLGAIIAYMPAFILAQVISATWYDVFMSGNQVAYTLMTTAYATLALAGVMLLATFLSLSYQFVIGDKKVADVFA